MPAETAILVGELVDLVVGADVGVVVGSGDVVSDEVWAAVLAAVDGPWVAKPELVGVDVAWTAGPVLTAVGRLVGFDRLARASFPGGP